MSFQFIEKTEAHIKCSEKALLVLDKKMSVKWPGNAMTMCLVILIKYVVRVSWRNNTCRMCSLEQFQKGATESQIVSEVAKCQSILHTNLKVGQGRLDHRIDFLLIIFSRSYCIHLSTGQSSTSSILSAPHRQYSSEISQPIQRRPSCSETTAVVPEPRNGSITVSPALEDASTNFLSNSSGFCVG